MLLFSVMVRKTRQLLLMLIAFAFIGGTSARLARPADDAAPMMMGGMPCAMMMSQPGIQHDSPTPPCKGMNADCKQICCVTDAALPTRTVNLDIAANFSSVDYWSAWSRLADFVPEPEPLPPRTI